VTPLFLPELLYGTNLRTCVDDDMNILGVRVGQPPHDSQVTVVRESAKTAEVNEKSPKSARPFHFIHLSKASDRDRNSPPDDVSY
jgi:hypothetical protein